ncbi:hypothetical protein JCM8097_003438 [Rhodosporidiobolus ruineniae]
MSFTALDLSTSSLLLPATALVLITLAVLAPKYGLVERFLGTNTKSLEPVKAPAKEEKPQRLPDPEPLLDFDLETATTRDHIYVNKTINNWIEIDKNYRREVAYKRQVIAEHPENSVLSLPENDEAAGELLETVVDFLTKRYPTLFEALPNCGVYNKILEERHENLAGLKGVDALMIISKLVQNDFLMAAEREDGHFYFVGGVVAIPGFYSLAQKIDKSMFNVHVPVPQFNEKLLVSVERTLKRFKPTEPFERSSWEIVDDLESYQHGIASLPEGVKLREDLHPKDYIFRIDHQTFRKLPRTQGIIFGVHPILRRLETFADLPLLPALLATVHENAPADLMKYKLAPCYQDRLLPYLKELTQSQIERGLIKGDEEVSNFRDLVQKS